MREETKRILKTIGYWYSDGKEHDSCPVCGINPNKLDDYIDDIDSNAYRRALKQLKGILKKALRDEEITKNPNTEIRRVLLDIELLEDGEYTKRELKEFERDSELGLSKY